MKVFAFVSALSLASSVLAHGAQDGTPLEKRQNNSPTVFVTGVGGTRQNRLEIRQMKDNFPDQYTLLVLAMEQWKTQPPNIDTGYYGVSSIHGVPRQDWNKVSQCNGCDGSDGYCPHDSILFPAWHRAYVALFEQEFIKVVKNIANSYPAGSQRDRYNRAANVMRWPYWDWAAKPPAGRSALPKIISDYTVFGVDAPNGRRDITPNPLFRFDFPGNTQQGNVYSPFTTWTRTYRYPTANDQSATSNTQASIDAFENIRQSLQDQIYQLFTTCKDYEHFSNDDAGSSSTQCKSSLEAIHNTVHNTAGGPGGQVSGGHMTYLPLGSFDPIFWLHHANVDRLFAMWQAINPNSYGGNQIAPHNTWTVRQGSNQGPDSPLQPFRRDYVSWWTTNSVRDWTVFGYSYPEFNKGKDAGTISNYVNQLYGPNANIPAGGIQKKRGLLDGLMGTVSGAMNSVTGAAASPKNNSASGSSQGLIGNVAQGLADALPGNPLQAKNGSTFEYFANIESPRYYFNGSYTVYIFNGNPTSENPKNFIFDKKLIGPFGVMAQDGMSNPLITSGSIPLTRTLQNIVGSQNSLLPGLTEALVVPFLNQNLKWRIVGPGGDCIDPGTVPGFSVSVVTSTAAQTENMNQLPTFSDFIPLLDVTKGQSGGLNSTIGGIMNSTLGMVGSLLH